jgi:hypothetical protein
MLDKIGLLFMNKVNIQMKKIMLKLIIVIFSALLFSANVNSAQRQDVKCYVELYGGAETVIFIETHGDEAKHLDRIARQWVNKKVSTQVSKGKKVIYKVHECALLNAPFKTNKAKAIDAITAR